MASSLNLNHFAARVRHQQLLWQLQASCRTRPFSSRPSFTRTTNLKKQQQQQQPSASKLTDNSSDENDAEDTSLNTKRLDVAIVGFPNAGKSQLLNALLGTKLAAVSRKRHTTRSGIMGVYTQNQTQLVFCDTPGFMTHANQTITSDLSMTAKSYLQDVDLALVVIDAAKTKLEPDYMNTISSLMWNALWARGGKGQFAIVLNKVDLVKPKTKLLDQAQIFGKVADQMMLEKYKLEQAQRKQQQQSTGKDENVQGNPIRTTPPPITSNNLPEIFYTCAKGGIQDEGVQDVLEHLLERAAHHPGDWMLPSAHHVTPMDYAARVEELIREKLYRQLHREVPHQIQQRNRQLELIRGDNDKIDGSDDATENDKDTSSSNSSNNVILIQQDLLVRTKAHLNLLQKNNGQNLQRVHDAVLPDLRDMFQAEVLLTLSAKLISRNRR